MPESCSRQEELNRLQTKLLDTKSVYLVSAKQDGLSPEGLGYQLATPYFILT